MPHPRFSVAGPMLLAMVAACAPVAPTSDPGIESARGMVVSTDTIASDIGAEVLRRGGNAMDAAIATGFALAVTHPTAGNIGGGGFMIVHRPGEEPTAFDFRERAPGASSQTMYLGPDGQVDRARAHLGHSSAGVPGTVRGFALAHARYGSLAWAELVLPAVRLAEEGFVLSESLALSLNGQLEGAMGQYPASVAAYGTPGGAPWTAGDTLILPDLGRALRAIAVDGADAFYLGWIADSIAADMARNGGYITKADLAAYEARERTPVRGRYRDYEIVSMPPPSSGGVALMTMLNLVEPLGLAAKGRYSIETLHWLIEVRRLAFLDRARWLGDPDFGDVPVAHLLSPAHTDSLRALVDPVRAGNSAALGADILSDPIMESEETTHYSVLDSEGMAVSTTYTLENGYGSRAVVRGAGFLLNDEMGDFNKKPSDTNIGGDIGTPANLIAPGKRMLSSMTPTIVTRDGQAVLITGSPGGRTIINTVFDIVLNIVEFDMTARAAVDAPRLHHQWLPDTARLEADAVDSTTLAALRAMGHALVQRGRQGDGHTILVDPVRKTAWGANDHRSAQSKVGVP